MGIVEGAFGPIYPTPTDKSERDGIGHSRFLVDHLDYLAHGVAVVSLTGIISTSLSEYAGYL